MYTGIQRTMPARPLAVFNCQRRTITIKAYVYKQALLAKQTFPFGFIKCLQHSLIIYTYIRPVMIRFHSEQEVQASSGNVSVKEGDRVVNKVNGIDVCWLCSFID